MQDPRSIAAATDGTPWVRHEKEFNARLEYMHLNPVKKGLVMRREGGSHAMQF